MRIFKLKTSKQARPEDGNSKTLKSKRIFTLKLYMVILSIAMVIGGVALFVVYFRTLNVAFGLPGFIIAAVGMFTFFHYWGAEGDLAVEHIAGEKKAAIVNSLNIYSDLIEFADVDEPKGFPLTCINLRKKFYVNIWDEATKKLIPFVLPDQQYCDPGVFAQRVLGLPAHRKIFEHKPKLLARLKTALLVLAIGIVWLLILTTTGS